MLLFVCVVDELLETYKCSLKNQMLKSDMLAWRTTCGVTFHWLFSGLSIGAHTPTNGMKTWRSLVAVTSHMLFLRSSMGVRTPTNDTKTESPLAVVTSLWHFSGSCTGAHMPTSYVKILRPLIHDFPLALFRVQYESLHVHKVVQVTMWWRRLTVLANCPPF